MNVTEQPFPLLDLSCLDEHPATLAGFHWLRYREPWNGDAALRLLRSELPMLDSGFAQAAALRYCKELGKPEHGRVTERREDDWNRFDEQEIFSPRRRGI